jgi:hypothetical protein
MKNEILAPDDRYEGRGFQRTIMPHDRRRQAGGESPATNHMDSDARSDQLDRQVAANESGAAEDQRLGPLQ